MVHSEMPILVLCCRPTAAHFFEEFQEMLMSQRKGCNVGTPAGMKVLERVHRGTPPAVKLSLRRPEPKETLDV
jgi:hypothetical protein